MAPNTAAATPTTTPKPTPATSTPPRVGGLPVSVVGPVDLGRLIRELDKIEDLLAQQRLRGIKEDYSAIKTSKLLSATMELNNITMNDDEERRKLNLFFVEVQKEAPILHMSFSSDPSPAVVEKIVAWLRKEIDPIALLTVGMQPNIGAGCILRTANHYFDFSLRKDFESKEPQFLEALREAAK